MSLFQRRDSRASRARDAVGVADQRQEEQSFVGLYLTDGSALFHVQQVISDPCSDATLIELENCGTLELIVCPRGTLDDAKLRRISPAEGMLEASGRSPDGTESFAASVVPCV